MTITRKFHTTPGYDCRAECKHEPKGRHGVCSEVWTFSVVDREARVGVELRVFTPFYPDTVTAMGRRSKFDGHSLSTHVGFPTCREDVLAGKPLTSDCALVGACYRGGSDSALDADTFVALLDVQAAARKLKAHGFDTGNDGFILEQQPVLWKALEEFLRAQVDRALTMRRIDGDLKWAVCACCYGKGLIERGAP